MNARFKSRAMAGEYEQKEKTCSIVLRRRGVGSNLLLVSLYAAVFGCHAVAFVTRKFCVTTQMLNTVRPLLFS